MTVTDITSLKQFEEIVKGTESDGNAAIFDFHAEWCGPCKIMSPIFHKLAERSADEKDAIYNPKLKFYAVDIDPDQEAPGIAADAGSARVAEVCSVTSIPAFHLYLKGKTPDKDLQVRGARRDSSLEDLVVKAKAE